MAAISALERSARGFVTPVAEDAVDPSRSAFKISYGCSQRGVRGLSDVSHGGFL